MVDQRSSRILLALLATLAVGLLSACDSPVGAYDPGDGGSQQAVTHGSPAAEADQAHPRPQDARPQQAPTQTSTPPEKPPPTRRAPTPHQPPEAGETPDGADANRGAKGDADKDLETLERDRQDVDEEDSADGEDGHNEGEDERDDKKWRIPTRGSGGDNPPDYIAPSDPKLV